MVVRVGGSFAYLPGDGMLTFEDHVQTVGDLRAAIEEKTQIPGKKQVKAGGFFLGLVPLSLPARLLVPAAAFKFLRILGIFESCNVGVLLRAVCRVPAMYLQCLVLSYQYAS